MDDGTVLGTDDGIFDGNKLGLPDCELGSSDGFVVGLGDELDFSDGGRVGDEEGEGEFDGWLVRLGDELGLSSAHTISVS